MLPDLSVVSHLNAGTVIVDGAAVLILVGMIIHTSLYRSRGRLDDKLFFAMLITDLVAAVCDGCNYLLENGTDPLAARLIMIGDTVFSAAFVLFSLLFALFVYYRAHHDSERIRKNWLYYALPAFLSFSMILGNLFAGYMFYVDENTVYHYGDWYDLIFVAPALYGVLCIVNIWRIDKRLVFLFLVMIAIRIGGGMFARGISTTPIVFAVWLAFIHILTMNHPFYAEEESV
jgi:hypothetical protein